MPKRLITFSSESGNSTKIHQFRIGQGISPELQPIPEGAIVGAPSGWPSLFQSPAGDFLGAASGGTAGVEGLYYWTDPLDLTTGAKITTPVFSGSVNCGAASNELLAIAGNNPFLYVLSRSDMSLKAVSTSGLGQVYAVAFSPDGSMLAVYHATAPYLRVYKTSDWSFVNVASGVQPSAPSLAVNGLTFSLDGAKLITASNGSLNIYNSATLARIVLTPTSWAGALILSKTNANHGFMAMHGTTNPCAARVDLTTGALSNVTGAPNCAGYSLALDDRERVLYVSLSAVSGDIFIRHFDADTLQELPIERGSLHQQVRAPSAALLILDTTPHQITGSVRDVGNNPAQRQVEAFDRNSSRLAAKTVSDPVTGNYVLRTNSAGPFDVRFKAANGELLNDLFYAKVMAEPIA